MANWSKMFEGLAETTGDYFDFLSKENKEKREAKISAEALTEKREYDTERQGLLWAQQEKTASTLATGRETAAEKLATEKKTSANTKADRDIELEKLKQEGRIDLAGAKSGVKKDTDIAKIMKEESAVQEEITNAIESGQEVPRYLVDNLNTLRAMRGEEPLSIEEYEVSPATESILPFGIGDKEATTGKRIGAGLLGVGSQQDRPPLSSFRK